MRARPSGGTVVAAALVLALALAAAAVARSQPKLEDAHPVTARAAATGALRIADSRQEAAILRAPALAPGAAVAGELTIRNRGAAARLLLSRHHLVEMPGAGGTYLTKALRLKIRDATPGSRKIVYFGPLAAMPTLHLGLLPAGASRRYRFLAKLPEPGFVDNSLAGSQVRFDYRWQLKPTWR
jgi:hypothetical protein